MKTDPNKDLFNFMKAHGFYKDYIDYNDFRVKKFGLGAEKDTLKQWKDDNLETEEEKDQFKFMFE